MSPHSVGDKGLELLRGAGVPPDRVSRIRAPAGLDLYARLLEEIAVSILVEIVQIEAARGKVVAAQKDVAKLAIRSAAR